MTTLVGVHDDITPDYVFAGDDKCGVRRGNRVRINSVREKCGSKPNLTERPDQGVLK